MTKPTKNISRNWGSGFTINGGKPTPAPTLAHEDRQMDARKEIERLKDEREMRELEEGVSEN